MSFTSSPSRVRFGGREIDGSFLFEMTGGRLCLDLVNTLDEREGQGRELLSTYGRLLEWSAQAGALPDASLSSLRTEAARRPRDAERALEATRTFRETLFRLLWKIGAGRRPSKRDIDAFNHFLERSGKSRRMAFVDGRPEIAVAKDELEAPLWPAVEDASGLLLDRQLLGRVRICAGRGCAWMFIDRSRRANRRWCDMSVCGNRAKARRHRIRTRGAGKPATPAI